MWFRKSRRKGLKCLYCMRARKESEDDDRVIMDRMEKRRSLNSCETRENGRKRSSLTTSISSFLHYKLCVCARKFCVSEHAFTIRLYDVRNVPSSYRQPGGRGQLLSRRYRTHSGWSFGKFPKANAPLLQGALAVSRKYFKQSKWPFVAAFPHARSSYPSYLRSTRYSSMWR